MDFSDKIYEIAKRLPSTLEHIQTEEATKNALIMPFISALGYDVFNPTEVVPEFTADIPELKKGEKVDYALKKNNQIIILIECKPHNAILSEGYTAQLYRYFSVVEARFAILTNGIEYHFFSDIKTPNVMDKNPFFTFDIRAISDQKIDELKKFTKASFDLDEIIDVASDLKYSKDIKELFLKEVSAPSDAFTRHFASSVYDGRLTASNLEKFKLIVKKTLNQVITDKISERLNAALQEQQEEQNQIDEQTEPEELPENGIITTQDEIDGFNIIKSICRKWVSAERIFMRDTKSYCGVLLDDNNRKPIARMHFNTDKKQVELFNQNKEGEKIPISSLDEIFDFEEKFKSLIEFYES